MATLTAPQWMAPYQALIKGQINRSQMQAILRQVLWPVMGIAVFLLMWQLAASHIDTSLGKFPGPAAVWEQMGNLVDEHQQARQREAAFHERQEKYIAMRLAQDPDWVPVHRDYTGAPTFFDQIGTSLITVMSGFLLASVIAIPLGIVIGLSSTVHAAMNPLIQLFKPVSPLAWLPLVTMVVSALYTSSDPMVAKSFLNSMFTVTLCCLWPTLLNTAVGVTSVSQDLLNVSRVLRLSALAHVRKIVLPSALPMMFTGLRLSLGIAWMVLIAAEMLAQNPGLGKFVWDEFQNGSSQSLSRIMVAVVVIGLIGFLLDRLMLMLQRALVWDKTSAQR
ncbi:nitrate ABC transporter permease [Alcanivorax hongdengensis A-11-3]|uniref:Nitrate ABC transporter permease n=1 Tax=Alcanivorax hongdengensis A-11-3 TaxID=1177179 RepID=L0WCT9_9GAMM|nr:ABC transporter permease [Alcanivorax hongdengensis]EKF73912.1 nitrate ABC transporter permease [Alcanivorax hongdengensis A-11-3]